MQGLFALSAVLFLLRGINQGAYFVKFTIFLLQLTGIKVIIAIAVIELRER